MRRLLLVLLGLLAVLGCGQDRERNRVVLVEVVSQPSSLLMTVSVGFNDLVTFEAETPIARDVHAKASCRFPTVTSDPSTCQLVAIASVKNGDATGVRLLMCLTDAGADVRKCEAGKDGRVSVTIEIDRHD